jgi:hypothetical protein
MSKEIKTIESELKPLANDVLSFSERANALVIASDEDYSSATEFVGIINEKKKAIEKARKFFVDPLNKQVKDINAMFKPQVDQADDIITTVKKKMGAFWQEKEKARLKEEARLQAIRDKANEKRAEQGKEEIAEPVKQVAEVAKTVTSDAAQSTVRKVWKHKVISINSLPEDVKKAIFEEAYRKGIIDTVIRKFVTAGIREMSGVEIYEDTEIAIRS